MKKILLIFLLAASNVPFCFSQSDTVKSTLHPDANTAYLDEGGAKIDAVKFMQAMGAGGYTMQPMLQDGRIKSLQLKKVENKVSTGAMAPGFEVTDMNGRVYALKNLKGKTVVLNFWFTNCPGCVKEMPELNTLADKYKDDPSVIFLAITFDEKQKVRAFLQKHTFNYHIAAGQAAMVQQYGIQAFPFSMVIDKTRHIAFSDNGSLTDVTSQLGSVIDMVSK